MYWSWFHIVPNGLVIQSTGLVRNYIGSVTGLGIPYICPQIVLQNRTGLVCWSIGLIIILVPDGFIIQYTGLVRYSSCLVMGPVIPTNGPQ